MHQPHPEFRCGFKFYNLEAWCSFKFSDPLAEEERTGGFYFKLVVAAHVMPLPHGVGFGLEYLIMTFPGHTRNSICIKSLITQATYTTIL